MTSMTKKLMLGAAIGALTMSGAFAQSPTSPSSNSTRPPALAPANPGTQAPPEKMGKEPAAKSGNSAENTGDTAKTGDNASASAGTAAAGKPKVVASQNSGQFLASNFDGTDVIGSDDKKIGDVADILFEKDGTIKAYVVSFGGFLGMGAKKVAIAPNAFEVVEGGKGEAKKLRLSMTEDDVKAAEKFTAYTPPTPSPAATTGSGRPASRSPLGAPAPGGR